MNIYTSILGLLLLTIGLNVVEISVLLKRLGFKEESIIVFKEAMMMFLVAFILLLSAQPQVIIQPAAMAMISTE